MNKLILIIAAALCIILAACSENLGNLKASCSEPNSPEAIAFIGRIDELNAEIADMPAGFDTDSLPREYTELIFPEGKNPGIGGKFTAMLNQLMSGNFSFDDLSSIFNSPEEQELLKNKDFKEGLSDAMNDMESDQTDGNGLDDIVMESYVESLDKYAENTGQVIAITNMYIKFVANSEELSEDSKDIMYMVFEIGASACKFCEGKL